MKYSIYIDQDISIKWGLTFQEAGLFSILYNLPSWASNIIIDNEIYYFASKVKIIKEIPLLTNKVDTMYRYYKKLEEKGLIVTKKLDGKDYIKLTEKAKEWNTNKQSEHSDKHPSELGQTSENNSDKHPTYNITNIDNITNDNSTEPSSALFPEFDKDRKSLFKNSTVGNIITFKQQFTKPEFQNIDVEYYFNSILDWNETKHVKRTAAGWLATARNWMRRDNEKGVLKTINGKKMMLSEQQIEYLKM